jgi:hypothetical protein
VQQKIKKMVSDAHVTEGYQKHDHREQRGSTRTPPQQPQINECIAALHMTLTKLSLMMAIAIFSKITAAYSSHMKKNTGPSTLFALTTEL